MRLFKLLQPLLELRDIESLVGVEIVEFERLGERFLLFEDAVDPLATVRMASLVLFFHHGNIVIKIKSMNKLYLPVLVALSIHELHYAHIPHKIYGFIGVDI